MVGSELPSSRDRGVDRHRRGAARAREITLADDFGAQPADGHHVHDPQRRGVGIAGVEGNGQAELVETVMGMRKPTAGRSPSVTQDMTSWGTRERREAGIGYIPEDRQRHGLLLDSPLWENRILGHQTQPPSVQGHLDQPSRRTRGHRAGSSRSTTSARRASTRFPALCQAATSKS